MQYQSELTKKHYSLSDRLRLFESVITPTVLYGSETWTLTAEMSRLLRTTQRRMLRMVLGQGRRRRERTSETQEDDHHSDGSGEDPVNSQEAEEDVLETWVDWIRRVTHSVENSLQRLRIKPWIKQARSRKWKFAAELFSGNGEQKWTQIALKWNPQVHSDALRPTARRKPTRPNLRWTDELRNYVKEHLRPQQEWNDISPNPDFWKMHESNFVNHIEN